MKVLCQYCEEINRFKMWDIVRANESLWNKPKKLLCKGCGFNTNVRNAATWTVGFVYNFLLLMGYRAFSPFILHRGHSILFEVMLSLLFMFETLFISFPLYAFFICFVNNCIARIEHRKWHKNKR